MARQASNKPLFVMISSTVRDLPEHRKQLIEACLRQSLFPRMMEFIPAEEVGAVAKSLAMVDEADIYLAVFAVRYGWVPKGEKRSITEMEYERAVARGIPRLIFLMGDDHAVRPGDVETGPGAKKLNSLKKRLRSEQIVNEFHSPDDLRAKAINSLAAVKSRLDAEAAEKTAKEGTSVLPASITSVRAVFDSPTPPEPYIVHPYTLLQTRKLIGRQNELNRLTGWINKTNAPNRARILSVVAIGGMGKSALTWHWFHEIAPQEMTPLAGRMWWSFYESDATFESLVAHALAYVSGRNEQEVRRELPSAPERESMLLGILDRQSFLVALDGLERTLVAYDRMDAGHRLDTDIDDEAADTVAGCMRLPAGASRSQVGHHPLRRTADLRFGQFLLKLARVRASRILITSRLYPAELETVTGNPLPGCEVLFLGGLGEPDALDLWRTLGAKGSREAVLSAFRTFDSHPLLIQVLAGEVANFRAEPGNFEALLAANPNFTPFHLPLVQVQSHVLALALRGLTPAEQRTLRVISGFPRPTSIDTLEALLIRVADTNRTDTAPAGPHPPPPTAARQSTDPAGGTSPDHDPNRPFATPSQLDACLTALEDRGLLGWDKQANRYDLHPIVRGVTWNGLDEAARQGIYGALHHYFQTVMAGGDPQKIQSVEDLTPAIELYRTLIGMRRYDQAFELYDDRLRKPLYYQLGEYEIDLQLLRAIPRLPDGLPSLSSRRAQTWNLLYESMCYEGTGRPKLALESSRKAAEINRRIRADTDLASALVPYAMQCCDAGFLCEARRSIEESVARIQPTADANWLGISHRSLGRVLMLCGDFEGAGKALGDAESAYGTSGRDVHGRSVLSVLQAYLSLRENSLSRALELARRALDLSRIGSFKREAAWAAWCMGEVLIREILEQGPLPEELHRQAETHLIDALDGCRRIRLLELEPNVHLALARLYHARGQDQERSLHAAEALAVAERSEYRLALADIHNFLAQVAFEGHRMQEAHGHARSAYRLAWCDGPPFAYHRGLHTARRRLSELGAPEPDLAPFDKTK
jgi:tetratricopeptide (TPR) repeat protein